MRRIAGTSRTDTAGSRLGSFASCTLLHVASSVSVAWHPLLRQHPQASEQFPGHRLTIWIIASRILRMRELSSRVNVLYGPATLPIWRNPATSSQTARSLRSPSTRPGAVVLHEQTADGGGARYGESMARKITTLLRLLGLPQVGGPVPPQMQGMGLCRRPGGRGRGRAARRRDSPRRCCPLATWTGARLVAFHGRGRIWTGSSAASSSAVILGPYGVGRSPRCCWTVAAKAARTARHRADAAPSST